MTVCFSHKLYNCYCNILTYPYNCNTGDGVIPSSSPGGYCPYCWSGEPQMQWLRSLQPRYWFKYHLKSILQIWSSEIIWYCIVIVTYLNFTIAIHLIYLSIKIAICFLFLSSNDESVSHQLIIELTLTTYHT